MKIDPLLRLASPDMTPAEAAEVMHEFLESNGRTPANCRRALQKAQESNSPAVQSAAIATGAAVSITGSAICAQTQLVIGVLKAFGVQPLDL